MRGGYGTKEYPNLSGLSQAEAREKGKRDGEEERERGLVYSSSDDASFKRPNSSAETEYSDAFSLARGPPTISVSSRSYETPSSVVASKDPYDYSEYPEYKGRETMTKLSDRKEGGRYRKSRKTRRHRK